MADIREPLMQSIETIVNKKLQEIKFDRTELCTVIQRDKNDSNKYLVTSNGGLTYYAYVVADGVEYARDQKVYVTIPQGNYETRKIIIGKYSEEDKDKLVQYTKPFDKFVAQQGYTFSSSLSVNANRDKSEQKEEVTGTIRFGANTFTKEGFGVYDYIGLTTSITTNFGGTKGSFELQFTFKDSEGGILLNSPLVFKSDQIYGNPYHLVPALKIQHLFNFPKERIEDVTKIKGIDIKLIADHNFNYTGESQSIVAENFTLQFGYNKTNLQNGTLNLYTTDNDLQYTTKDSKTLYCYLYEDIITGYGTYSNYNASGYEIYWLQYQLGYTKDLTKPKDEDIEESGAWWKTLKKYDYNDRLNGRRFNDYTFSFKPNLTLPEMRIKVAIVHKTNNVIDQYYESDVLTFTNTNTTPQVTGNATQYEDLQLTLDTGNDGIYNEYGIDNKLLANVLYPKYRIKVSYLDGTKWEEEDSRIRQVIWKIPKTGTMLTRPYTLQVIDGKKVMAPDPRWEDGAEVEEYGDRYENFYIYVSHDPDKDEGEDSDEAQGHVVWYGITNQFDYSRTNNIIECEIVRTPATAVEDEFRKTQHYGSFQFQFGTQGTSGTNFAFNIYPNRPGGLSWEGSDSLTFTARLESDGQEIEFNDSRIEWFIDSINVQSGSKTYEVKNTNINIGNFTILIAELPITTANNKRILLKAYYPIARMNVDTSDAPDYYYYIEGPSRVVYNFQGSDPTYDDKSVYKLFDSTGEEIKKYLDQQIHWDIIQKDSEDSSDNYPSLEPKWNGNILVGYKLKPLGSKQTKPKSCAVRAYAQIGESTVDLYYQPLVILTNEYAFPFLNDWDGTTTIDEEDNKILSQIIGAGIVNSSNQYTGILMGALGKTRNDAKTGLYGLQNGTLRYKLDEDGAFYVGDENNNFISFNEGSESGRSDLNQLVIKVEKFKLNTSNLLIDSTADDDNPVIKFQNKFQLNADGSATIGGWTIANDRIYNISKDTNYTFSLWNPAIAQNQIINCVDLTTNPPTTTFFIDRNGKIYASNVDLNGKITATSGFIGGWEIVNGILRTVKDGKATFLQPPNSGYWGIAVGAKGPNYYGDTAPFRVDHNGNMFAESGTIGGWRITSNRIYNINTATGYTFSLWDPSQAGGTIISCNKGTDYQFYVNRDGSLIAKNATITGTIFAQNGSFERDITIGGRSLSQWINSSGEVYNIQAINGNIGGWVIGNYYIRSSTGVYGQYRGINASGTLMTAQGYLFVVLSCSSNAYGLWYVVKSSNNFNDNTVASFSAARGNITILSGGGSL